jgi:hypothetical protein
MALTLLRLSITLVVVTAYSQAVSQVIKGQVREANTAVPLSNAYVTTNQAKTITDTHGYFSIRVKPFDTLTISHVGYDSRQLCTDLNVDTLIITLTPATVLLKPITVLDYMTEESLKNKILETPVVESEEIINARDNMLKTRILFNMGYRAPMTETEKFQHYLKGPQGFTFFSSSGGSIFKAIKNIIQKPEFSFKSFNRNSKPSGMMFIKDRSLLNSSYSDSLNTLPMDTTATR